jgi:hypothetical protein
MGTREEGKVSVTVKGYSGKIRPHQAQGGKCHMCGDVVYVDPDDKSGASHTVIDRIMYVHWGCS